MILVERVIEGSFGLVFVVFFLKNSSLDACFRSRLNVIPMHCLWHELRFAIGQEAIKLLEFKNPLF